MSHDNVVVADPSFPAAEGEVAVRGSETDFSGAFRIFKKKAGGSNRGSGPGFSKDR